MDHDTAVSTPTLDGQLSDIASALEGLEQTANQHALMLASSLHGLLGSEPAPAPPLNDPSGTDPNAKLPKCELIWERVKRISKHQERMHVALNRL